MIQVVVTPEEGQTLEAAVDAEIAAFDKWFQSAGNDPLVRSERAILKTFFWFRTHGDTHGSKTSG